MAEANTMSKTRWAICTDVLTTLLSMHLLMKHLRKNGMMVRVLHILQT